MAAYLLVVILVISLFCSMMLHEHLERVSKLFLFIGIALIIWGSFSISNLNQEKKFLGVIPVKFENKIAFASYEDQLINCSKDFKIQFKPGDSIYVFKEVDTWRYGIRWDGGNYIYKTHKNEK